MRLRSLLFGDNADAETTGEVLEYFMRRLSSVQTAERDSAVKVCIAKLFSLLLLCLSAGDKVPLEGYETTVSCSIYEMK